MTDWRTLIPEPAAWHATRVLEDIGAHKRIWEILQNHNPRSADRVWSEVGAWTGEERRLAALALHHHVCMYDGIRGTRTAALRWLAESDAPWTREDLIWCLSTASESRNVLEATDHLELPAAIAARLDPRERTDLRPVLHELLAHVITDHYLNAEGKRGVTAALGRALDRGSSNVIPHSLFHNGDGFGPLTRAALREELAAPGVAALLLHCGQLERPAPAKPWRKRLEELLACAPSGPTAARAVLGQFVNYGSYVHDDTDRIVRGLIWTLGDGDTELLARVAATAGAAGARSSGYPYAPRAAAAAVLSLGRHGGDSPLKTLARMSLTVKNKALNSRVQAALIELGALRGWSPSEVMELSVPDHGLDADRRLVTKLSGYEAIVSIEAEKARLTFAREGRPLMGMPAALKDGHDDDIKALKATVKEISATLVTERQRVESLLSEERDWSYQDWVSRLLEHPVTSAYGGRLIWETTVDGGTWAAGLARRDLDAWVLVGVDGQTHRGERVRLWHPIRASVDEVVAWRTHVMAVDLSQPFKQAFREVYLLTPAERQTHAYSNRFAAHILRYRQANALMRARGWRAGYLGTWDGGYDSEAAKQFGGGLWRALFHHQYVEDEARSILGAQYCSTDQVRFERRDGAVWERVPVTDVPAAVFSEAMRDVDLFVGVTSIAADPEWVDRGDDRFQAYWHRTVFAELTASAEIRRDALARLLPRMKIANRVELIDRFLHVRGNRGAYKIHVGSGNILMEPNDAYLCIVAAKSKNASLRLPFAEDAMLSMIISKALLLAADDKITDRTILSQLHR
jgi:hypothetical protein